jgi:hypothetical protein
MYAQSEKFKVFENKKYLRLKQECQNRLWLPKVTDDGEIKEKNNVCL